MMERLCCLEKATKLLQKEVDELSGQIGYVGMDITSFTVSPSTAEIGSTVASLTFNWVLNKPAATQVITPGSFTVAPPATTLNTPVSITSSTVYTLTADDGTAFPGHSDTATATVSFRHKVYWGTSGAAFLDSAGILGLGGSAFATGRARTFTVDGGGEYIYYAYPNSYDSGGDATFTVNGFPTSGWVKTTVSFLNASGNTTLFSVYRSAAVQSGTGISVTVY